MSDPIKHECGIAMVRLLKPLDYYIEKYGTFLYGLNKLYLLMEKQHNRGQDGAGVANIKLDVEPGTRYISRYRSNLPNPIKDIFAHINERFAEVQKKSPEKLKDTKWLQENLAFTGEVSFGHLRYGTFGGNSIENCHPFLKQSNWKSRNLVVAGNFNLTNVKELFDKLVEMGQHPKGIADTVTVMEKIGHFLDLENDELYRKFKAQGLSDKEAIEAVEDNLDLPDILRHAAKRWDGGYAMGGLVGSGDSFVLRDPAGVRPAFYYQDDEVLVITSERPPIMTAFNVPAEAVKEIPPGHAIIATKNHKISIEKILEPLPKKPCSFERIYFSRGSDLDIYKERKELGKLLCPAIMDAVDQDFEHSVFSFIPNTAEVSFFGMREGLKQLFDVQRRNKILELPAEEMTAENIDKILKVSPRVEKVAIKDAKLRTFITEDTSRDELVKHVYDVTYGSVKAGVDNVVAIDDSIVRGTTLKQSIIQMLDRLQPKRIVIVSSAPQIRFPDCYGIDMAKLGDFIAFQAAISLLKERGMEGIITEVYEKCKTQTELPDDEVQNFVKEIYAPFTDQEISDRIATLITSEEVNAEVKVIYQTVDNLHIACPEHKGDWYFTGDYPTPGGNRVVNRAFINFFEGRNERAY